MADFSLNSLSGWLTACSVKGYQLQMVSDNKHDQIRGRFRRGALAETWFWRSLVSIHPFSFGLLINSFIFLSFSLINPFSVCFFQPLNYHYIICSIHYRTSRAWMDKTHKNWKNELWISSVSVYYLLFHSRYLLKQITFSENHNVPMWQCSKEAIMRPSVQGSGFCSHYSSSLKITNSVCESGYCNASVLSMDY